MYSHLKHIIFGYFKFCFYLFFSSLLLQEQPGGHDEQSHCPEVFFFIFLANIYMAKSIIIVAMIISMVFNHLLFKLYD